MRRLKQIWFLAGAVVSLMLILDIFTTRLSSGGWLWYLLVVPLLGTAAGSRNAAFNRRAPDRFHIKQIWFIVGAIAALAIAEELLPSRWLIGIGGGYVLALALVGGATGSVIAAFKR
jgi:hypothetical protein